MLCCYVCYVLLYTFLTPERTEHASMSCMLFYINENLCVKVVRKRLAPHLWLRGTRKTNGAMYPSLLLSFNVFGSYVVCHLGNPKNSAAGGHTAGMTAKPCLTQRCYQAGTLLCKQLSTYSWTRDTFHPFLKTRNITEMQKWCNT